MGRYYVADFETTAPKTKEELTNFKQTEVWGAGICEVGTENVSVFGCIKDFLDCCAKIPEKRPVVYFHNLKFDGSFIIDYLLRYLKYEFNPDLYKIQDREFSTSISSLGVWYIIRVKYKRKTIEFRDSAKLLPFPVEQIAKQLGTKAQKLVGTIDYNKKRELTWEQENGMWYKRYHMDEVEKKYLTNDILVMSEALEKVAPFGLLDYLTIGSCCMADYRKRVGKMFEYDFPLLDRELDKKLRQSYHGGWCYVKEPEKEHKGVNGCTYDVNSLYPWAMHSNDEHWFPVGLPKVFSGDKLELYWNKLWIIHIKVDIQLKPRKLPFIQLVKNGPYVTETDGMVELWLTKPDYILLLECYDIIAIDIIEGYWFGAKKGIFDEYIEHWYGVKKDAKNKVERQIAKLMLNNLYGKMATSPVANSYVPRIEEEGEKVIMSVEYGERDSVYVPVAAFITSYARCKTIRAAIANIDVFQYADTDSIHCTDYVEGIAVGKELGEWKLENNWDRGKFVRCKTYIEHTIAEDEKPVEPYWLIKAAGCPDEVKTRLLYKVENWEDLTIDKESDIILNERRSDDEFVERFSVGLCETGKLGSKRIVGGVVLINTTFQIRG